MTDEVKRKRGRPAKHADSAARKADYLEGKARFDLVVPEKIGATIRDLASTLDISANQVILSALRHSFTAHNWKVQGQPWAKVK